MITLGSTQTAAASHTELARAGPSLPERERSTRSARAHEPSQRITEQPRQLLEPRGDSRVHLAGSRPPTKRGRAHRGLDVVVAEAGRCAARGGYGVRRAQQRLPAPKCAPTTRLEMPLPATKGAISWQKSHDSKIGGWARHDMIWRSLNVAKKRPRHWKRRIADESTKLRSQLPCWCRAHRSERPRSRNRRRPQLCAKPPHRRRAAQRASASSLPATGALLKRLAAPLRDQCWPAPLAEGAMSALLARRSRA